MTARRNKSHTQAAAAEQPSVMEAQVSTTAPLTGRQAAEEFGPPAAGTEGQQRRRWQPDPFPFMAVTLGPDKSSPKMTLYRSNKLNQLAIQFEEKPAEEHRRQLREAGWRWREDEGVWTKQMDRERRATAQMEAERLFSEIGEAIRAERGLSGRSDVGG
jgi:hypothetical protein